MTHGFFLRKSNEMPLENFEQVSVMLEIRFSENHTGYIMLNEKEKKKWNQGI